MRAGFLGTGSSNRLTLSAGYYGNTELSGNLWESIVNVSQGGLSYNGQLGNGILSNDGNANVTNWIQAGSFLNTLSASGTGYVGGAWMGAWYGGDVYLRVSERNYDYFHDVNTRYSNVDGRGCR